MKLILIALIIGILLMSAGIQAQQQTSDCPDRCVNSALYQKGALDAKTKLCAYAIQEPCKFGCESKIISCKQFPDTPPANTTDYSETIWNMVRSMWGKESLKGSMGVFGTEYVLGQNGTLFIKLLDSNELPINNGFCSITVYYPNKAIKFMDNAPTAFLENGIYYKDFFVPSTEGLYIADASCMYADTVYRYNIPSENCGYNGNIVGGTSPQPLTFSDVDCTPFQTSGIGSYQNWTFSYASIGIINLSAISQIDVNWVGQVASLSYLQLYNFNSSAWDTIGTSIANTGIAVACGNNVYMTRSTTANITSYVSSNTIKARVYIPSAAGILTDAIEIILHNNGSVVANLRGSSEVHVNDWSVWDDIFVILKDINYTTNTTLELKLDIINATAWDTWLLLQNLTIGNVSVTANVNWTEGYVETTLLSFGDNINGEAIELQTETLSCISNTTLQHSINGTKWINGVWYPFNETTTEICQFGCANSMCSPSPLNGALYFFAFIAVILVVAGVIYTRKR